MAGIVIIGNGIAGATAAIRLRELTDMPVTMISSETRYFYSRTALMYIFMGQLRYSDTKPYEDQHWTDLNINLVYDHVTGIDPVERTFRLKEKGKLPYDSLLIATGSSSRKGKWKGESLEGVHSLYSIHDLRKIESATNNITQAVVTGGGLIGIELCEMLHYKGIHVKFLIREPFFMGGILSEQESRILEEHITSFGVEMIKNTEVTSFRGDQKQHLRSVELSNGQVIDTTFAGVTIGVEPNIGLVEGSSIQTNRGILVDEHLKTNVSGIYAAGDCAELRDPGAGRKAIEPVWYTGKLMGEVAARNMTGQAIKYDPGYWFNSAKFFHLEYQVYGWIPSTDAEGHTSFFWKNRKGNRCLRIHYNISSGAVTGCNFIGLRARQKICEEAFRSRIKIDQFISSINRVLFDQEFTEDHPASIKKHFENLKLITS